MVERVKRLPWGAISLVVSGLLSIAFVVAMFAVAGAFHDTNDRFARAEARDAATARVASCDQFNRQQAGNITGTVAGVVAYVQPLLEGRPRTDAANGRLWRGLAELYRQQVKAHPRRDCEPLGIDRYLGLKLGSTAAALEGAPTP